jgi:predicted RNase H-like HicB family nuclease/DNA-binding XRE family transcriptional regulator
MKYHFRLEPEDVGFSAECLELEGCLTEGDDLDEVKKNASEALNLYLDEPQDSRHVFNMPNESLKGKDIIEVEVEADIAFAMLMRQYRIERQLTQAQMADKLGMNRIYSYQRLERKANPSLDLLKRIKRIIPDFPLDAIFS